VAARNVTATRESGTPAADVTSTKMATTDAHVPATTATTHVTAAATATAHVTATTTTAVTAASASATAVTLGARHERRSSNRNGGQHSEGPGENSCTVHLDHGFTPSRRISRCSRGIRT
jgi:hypothetical protein